MSLPLGGSLRIATLLVAVLAVVGCSHKSLEERAREQAEKVIGAMGEAQNQAMEQKASPEDITQAQQALTRVHEYMGEVNGKLDAVTINAIQAYQRTHGLKDDGILNGKTQRLLSAEVAQK